MRANNHSALLTDRSAAADIRVLGIIILGSSMVSFTSVFVELSHVGPTVAAFYRMFFGGIILLIITVLKGERLWYGIKSLALPFLCALFFSLDLFFWHRSIIYVGPGLATILGNMQVFFVALFAVWLLKERMGWRLMVAIPVAVLGLFLIVGSSWGQQDGAVKLGVLFGLFTALAYALYILTLRKSQSANQRWRYPLFANMTWICLLSALLLGLSVIIEPEANFVIPDLQTWSSLLGMAIMGQVLGWVLISKGLPGVDASVGGLALLLQPALAFVWDILFFGRPTSVLDYTGAVIILGAIYLGSTGGKKAE